MTHATCHIPTPLCVRREAICTQEQMEPMDKQKGVVPFVDVCCAPQYQYGRAGLTLIFQGVFPPEERKE